MEQATSSVIGRACADASMFCHADELRCDVLDLATARGRAFCAVTFRAGACGQTIHIERNAHALAVAERAFRAVADRLAEIQADSAEQEMLDLATVEAYTGGEE